MGPVLSHPPGRDKSGGEEIIKKDPPVIPEKWEFGTKLDDWNYFRVS
ncbi:MAG: hypothetical protein N2V78_12955 [Methanophagales archaeon]|nr:hypothetical protein [Methanophagales archaeon]